MNKTVKKATVLLNILPENEQNFALEIIKKLVRAWDPDYTKLTPSEKAALDEAEEDMIENGTISHEDINWD